MTYRPTTLLLSALAATAFAGCQPKGDLGEYTATDADTGASEAESAATTGASVGMTGTPSEGSGDTSDTGSEDTGDTGSEDTSDTGNTGNTSDTGDTGNTGDTGVAVCASELDFQASFTAVIDPPLPLDVTKFSADCTVDVLTVEGNFVHVELGCGERDATIDFNVSTSFTPLFAQGDTVSLTYHETMPFWSNQWFVLRHPEGGGLLLGGVAADSLLPLDDDDATLFDPVHIAEVPDVCATPSGCDNPFQRLALAVSYDQTTQQVVPGNSVLVGMLTSVRVDLGSAFRFVDVDDCALADVPPEWYSALLIMLPEG